MGFTEGSLSSRTKLRELMWAWDPVGLRDVRPQVSSEYDGLADIALAMIRKGYVSQDITERLISELRQNWGVEAPPFDLKEGIESIRPKQT